MQASLAVLLAALTAAPAVAAPFRPPDPARRIQLTPAGWRPVTTACPASPPPAALRQRIVDVAAEEWARFGFPTEELLSRNLTRIYSPPRGVIVSPGLNPVVPGVARRAMRMGQVESDRDVQAAIGGYWTAAPDGAGIAIQNQLRAEYRSTGWAVPWSAAFVSYVMCASGAGRMDQFARSDSHSTYVDQAIAAADGRAPRAIYRARDLARGLPAPGDLICNDRSWPQRYRTVADRRGQTDEAPLHCDIVVRIDRRGGFVAAIGGNVSDAVTLSMFRIVKPRGAPARLETAQDMPGAKSIFAVLELQTGGAASLDRAPAIRRLRSRR